MSLFLYNVYWRIVQPPPPYKIIQTKTHPTLPTTRSFSSFGPYVFTFTFMFTHHSTILIPQNVSRIALPSPLSYLYHHVIVCVCLIIHLLSYLSRIYSVHLSIVCHHVMSLCLCHTVIHICHLVTCQLVMTSCHITFIINMYSHL